MPGDYTRKLFDRKKHYSGVLMQQGRVQLDADWNEQLDLQLYRTWTEATDVIGLCGTPKHHNGGNGFKITSTGTGLQIEPGRIYVQGLLCELEQAASYANQPHYPNPDFVAPIGSPPSSPPGSPPTSPPASPSLQLADGTYVAYLDAWHREITALDDPLIREKALGGPDTTTRLQTVWQVRLLRVSTNNSNKGDVTCKTAIREYGQLIAAATGRMTAKTKDADPQKDPCQLPPQAGYQRLENQLYRVEVHTGGTLAAATFKWSRDNATVEAAVQDVSGSIVTVSEIGKDDVLSFHIGDWVELVTEASTLNRTPNPLMQIQDIDSATRQITLPGSVQSFANVRPLKLRRWDQNGAPATATGVQMDLAGWVDLEGNIQVNFSGGNYRAGDYWLIPARTATGEIEWPPFAVPNSNPSPQPPVGDRHRYCKLALAKVAAGKITVEDCRRRFPSLTEICAEDVCYDNSHCQMPGVETVQDALDRLCETRDLRHHNKHLHGWGIVCGLQVECGPEKPGQPRHQVTVKHGYALDCEGNDIILQKNEVLDIAAMNAALGSPPQPLTDGELSLYVELDAGNQPRFRLERYAPPKNKWMAALEGTLLMDFINECVLKLADFFREQFTDRGQVKSVVSPAQKRLSTAMNLIVQLFNTQNGSLVYLSRREHEILRKFYNDLRALLQSHTFCAMFDGARPFPEQYPFDKVDASTIFGKGLQRRLRVSPNNRLAYTAGASGKIGVFDLKLEEMIAELDFPASGAIVKDLAFSPNGNQLYAVAVANNKDSVLAVADISGDTHKWRTATAMVADVQFVTLGTAHRIASNNVYAVGLGKGIWEINIASTGIAPKQLLQFNATGQLAMLDTPQLATAFAAAFINSTGGPPAGALNDYTHIMAVNLRSPGNSPAIPLAINGVQQSGRDDIAVSQGPNNPNPKLYAVVQPPPGSTTKHVMIFDAVGFKPLGLANLGEADLNSDVRLLFNPTTNRMAVSYEEGYKLGLLNEDDRLEANFRFPVQISPVSLALSPGIRRFYALNLTSNTITSLSAELLHPKQQLPLQPLVAYRTAVLNAFFDLAGGLLQYLKDCLCDHFLVNCPTCDKDDKVYLAVVSIRNRQVQKVCNFSLRKYVKSFPTVDYWLSLVPVIPLFTKLVEEFCCAALPTFFGKRSASGAKVNDNVAVFTDVGNNRIKGAQIRSTTDFFKGANFSAAWNAGNTKVRAGASLIAEMIAGRGQKTTPSPSTRVAHADITGQPVEDARRKLADARIKVASVEPFDPDAGFDNLIAFGTAPLNLEEGMQVKLITKDDRVLYYAKVQPESAQFQTLREEVAVAQTAITGQQKAVAEAAQLRAEVKTLKDQMLAMEKKHQDSLANRDKETAEIKATADDLKLNIQAVQELREQVAKLSKTPGRTLKSGSDKQPK